MNGVRILQQFLNSAHYSRRRNCIGFIPIQFEYFLTSATRSSQARCDEILYSSISSIDRVPSLRTIGSVLPSELVINLSVYSIASCTSDPTRCRNSASNFCVKE